VVHLAIGFPVGLLGLLYLLLVCAGTTSLIGPIWLPGGVLGAGWVGAAHRWLGRRLLGVAVEPPAPVRFEPGVLGWIRSGLTYSPGWRALGFLAVKLPLGILDFAVFLLFWLYGVLFLTYPLWFRTSRGTDTHGREYVGVTVGDLVFNSVPRALILSAVGVLLLLAAPWPTRMVLRVETSLMRRLLGSTREEELVRTRAQVADDSAASLRRIERDLHDGAQTQLISLALQLGLAREELRGGDASAALELVDTAHRNAKQALEDLRDLVRGIHPPVLDSGLAPALQTLAARSGVPVQIDVALADRPSPAIETIAYFSAAELLANVAKHSRARAVTLTVTQLRCT
jgi:signal transduction histidine kinase